MRWRQSIAVGIAALVIVGVSLCLLSYARWVRGVADGSRALASGNFAGAEQAYTAAEKSARQPLLPFALLRPGYRMLVFNEARLLDKQQKYDELGRFLPAVAAHTPELANDPEYHFWMGTVEYRRAISQTDKQMVRAGIQQAADSFRLALAASNGADWDAKYNYELTSRLLAGMRDKNEDKPEKLNRGGMKILREDPDHPKEQQQRLAPDKQS
jgi:hypothetical protein